MKMIDNSPCCQPERIILIGRFVRWFVVGCVQERSTLWIVCFVLLRCSHCASSEIVSEVFAVVCGSIERTAHIQMLASVRKFFIARPLLSLIHISEPTRLL